MATGNTAAVIDTTYELDLEHSDIVGMMNDPSINLEGGHVSADQEFELVLRKSSGGEVLLKSMTPTDILVIRYTKVTT